MTDKTDALIARAINWYHDDRQRLAGLVLYGSAARGTTHETSDVDLVVVAQPGQRDALWADRHHLAKLLLNESIAWSHELPWQGNYRYQAWRSDLLSIDLTIDDGRVDPHQTFDTGQPTVIAGELNLPKQPVRGPASITPDLVMETWIWFLGIHNQLQQNRNWDAYYQLVQLLDTRLRPLIDDHQLRTLDPAAATRPAILTALKTAVDQYQRLFPRDNHDGENTLAIAIRDHILNAKI